MRRYLAAACALAFAGMLCLEQGSQGGDLTLLGAGVRPAAGGGGGLTWDPANSLQNVTLTNSNKTATDNSNGPIGDARSTNGKSSGKWYIEISNDIDTSQFMMFGVQNSSYNPATASNIIGYETAPNSIACQRSGGIVFQGANVGFCNSTIVAPGDTVGMSLDIGNNKIWWRVRHSGAWGNWNNSGTDDPATNTGGLTALGAATYYIGFGSINNADQVTMDPTCGIGPAPSGFTCWN